MPARAVFDVLHKKKELFETCKHITVCSRFDVCIVRIIKKISEIFLFKTRGRSQHFALLKLLLFILVFSY